jgi:hypothetical protein
MNSITKKFLSLTLSFAILFGSLGIVATTEASPAHDRYMDAGDPPPPPHDHANPPPKKDKGHSSGEVTTAAIVGAAVGAIIAKNT